MGGGLFSNFYSDFFKFLVFWVFLVFWGNFWVFVIFKNVFGMRMGDFGGGLFSNFYSDFDFFFGFWGFGGHFWVFEIFENVFGMRMGDFGGVYLVKFIHLRAFYMTFEDVHRRRTDAGRRTDGRTPDNGRCIDVPLLRNGHLIIY